MRHPMSPREAAGVLPLRCVVADCLHRARASACALRCCHVMCKAMRRAGGAPAELVRREGARHGSTCRSAAAAWHAAARAPAADVTCCGAWTAAAAEHAAGGVPGTCHLHFACTAGPCVVRCVGSTRLYLLFPRAALLGAPRAAPPARRCCSGGRGRCAPAAARWYAAVCYVVPVLRSEPSLRCPASPRSRAPGAATRPQPARALGETSGDATGVARRGAVRTPCSPLDNTALRRLCFHGAPRGFLTAGAAPALQAAVMEPDPASLGQPLRQASSGELHPSRMSRRVLGSPQGTCCVLRSALWPR